MAINEKGRASSDVSIVVVSGKHRVLTTKSIKACPEPYELNINRTTGLGLARHEGILKTRAELIFMFDDDLILNPEIWPFLFSLKEGEFMMANVGEHLSARVFAIHRKDYFAIGGFDTRIKYIFEDGDFYLRALKTGLTFRAVPKSFYEHVYHTPRMHNRYLAVRLSWEYSKMYVKYGRDVCSYPLEFFRRPFNWRIIPFHFLTKTVGIPYYLLRRDLVVSKEGWLRV